MPKIQLNTDGKPNLQKLMQENPQKAKELVQTFVDMMEHAASQDASGYAWIDLPEKFHPDLTFKRLINDILHGVLDVHDMSPDLVKDLGIETHPLTIFSQKHYDIETDKTYFIDWKRHFDLKESELDNPIQSILRKSLYYARHISFPDIADAIWNSKQALYWAEFDPTPNIPIQPAMKYQYEQLGHHYTGRYRVDIGFLDGGSLNQAEENSPAAEYQCNACRVTDPTKTYVKYTDQYKLCLKCGISFSLEGENK